MRGRIANFEAKNQRAYMEHIYKTVRDIGIKLASSYESLPLLEEVAKAAKDLVGAQEAYALILDENGRLQIHYSSTPAPLSIETLRTAIAAGNFTNEINHFSTDACVCIRLPKDHFIYLAHTNCSPNETKLLNLFREQTALQLRGILQHEKVISELRNSKNQYQNLLTSLQEGVWAIDAETNTTFVNNTMAAMLGYSVEEMIGKPLFAFMDEEGVAIANNNRARRKEGVEEKYPFKLINKQGNPVYTLMESSPIRENGRYVGAIAGVMNVTAREYALEELRYSEKRFRDLVNATSDWIWEIDANGLYSYSNKAITNLLGYLPDDILGTAPLDVVPPKEFEQAYASLADIQLKKVPFKNIRTVTMHKNGTLVHFSSAGAPIIAANGELIGYRGISRDITNLVKQEKERNLSQKKVELLLSVLNGINLAPTFKTALDVAIRLISKHTGWIYGEAWAVASKRGYLRCDATYIDKKYQARLDSFNSFSEQTTYAYGEGVPGRVWHSQKVLRYENIDLLPTDKFSRTIIAGEAGLKALLAVPAITNKTTMAVMIFYADTPPEENSQEMALITAVASQLGLILQQKQTEETLRKLSRAVEQSPTSIFITDLDGKIEFINPAFTQISGYSYSQIVGKTPSALRSDQTSQTVHHNLWSTLQQGKTWKERLLNKRKNGSLVWVQSIMSPIKDQNGNTTHYLCIQSDINEQVKAESTLQASETRTRALIETIPDLMFLINKDGVFTESYNADVDYLLMPPDTFLNRNVTDILPPAIAEQTMGAIETTLRTGKTSQFDYALLVADNTILGQYEARLSRASANFVLALIRDVTTEWQATERLRESRCKLARAQALAHLGSWEWTITSNTIVWSDEMYRLFGREPQSFEVTPEKVLTIIYPEDVEVVANATQQAVATGKPYEIEYRLQRPSGEMRVVRGRGELTTDENGNPMRLVGASLDITDQVIALQKIEQAKEEAQQSEQKLARAQAIAHLGSWEWDEREQTILWSDETYRMAGYEPQSFSVTLAKFWAMLHPDDLEKEKAAVSESFRTKKPYLVRYRLKRPSGEMRYIEERGEPFYAEGTLHLAGTTLDITDQVIARQKLEKATKKAWYLQQEAERANQAKSLFLTNMSHELRTPLNGILGYTQLLRQDENLSAQQLHGINVIHRSGEHLLFMINDMLDLAKIEAGKMTLSVGDCHLSEMLTSLIDMISQSATQKGIRFSHRLAAGLPQKVMIDGVRLRQILLNLLSNAVKFTDSGAVLLEVLPVETAVSPTTPPNTNPSRIKIRFRIEDTGIGIAPELLETIFSPFKQVNVIENNIEGTGLGLAISQRLATLLGSKVQVSSRLGKGSVFWFDLDLEIAQGSRRSTENTNFKITPISGVHGNEKLRMLIVDDTESNRYILQRYFSTLSGFEVMDAGNGKEGVAKAADFNPHVVLMDLRMPIMDGIEAARQIRLLPSFEKGIIIAVSADVYANIRKDVQDATFDDFATKPLDLMQLSEKIKLLLSNEWQWEYTQKEVTPAKTKMGIIRPLPEKETAVLLDLAYTGDIRNLRNKLAIFKKNLDPQYHATIDKLAQLTREFRIKHIRELLEKL